MPAPDLAHQRIGFVLRPLSHRTLLAFRYFFYVLRHNIVFSIINNYFESGINNYILILTYISKSFPRHHNWQHAHNEESRI